MIAIIDTQANAWLYVFDPKNVSSAAARSVHDPVTQTDIVRVELGFMGSFSVTLDFFQQHHANLLLSRIFDPGRAEDGLFKLCLSSGECTIHTYEGEYGP